MTAPYFELRDARSAELRTACTAIELMLARLPQATTTAPISMGDELRAQWHTLVTLLALEAPRVLRECPVCKHVGMLEATRCGHCWAKLAPATG